MHFLRCTGIAAPAKRSIVQVSPRVLRRNRSTSKTNIDKYKSLGKSLIAATRNQNTKGWKVTGPQYSGLEYLKDALLNEKRFIAHPDKSNFFSGHPLESITADDLTLSAPQAAVEPGAFIEARRLVHLALSTLFQYSQSEQYRNGSAMNGVVIKVERQQTVQMALTLITSGEVLFIRASDIMFMIPRFIDADLSDRCGEIEEHQSEHELAARLKVLKRARDFERAVEYAYNLYGPRIAEVYEKVRAQSPDEWGKVSTLRAVRILDESPNASITNLFAVHKQLMSRNTEYLAHPLRHRQLHEFDVRPLSHLQNLLKVTSWIRSQNAVIEQFQNKVSPLVDISRRLQLELHDGLPERVFPPQTKGTEFNEFDLEIIRALKASLITQRHIQRDPYELISTSIIKGTMKYKERLSPVTTITFLRDIGVYTPWEDVASKALGLNLPQDLQEVIPTPGRISGLLNEDPHESVRHDFGQLPVFVIDNIGSEELDDGISFETIPNEPGNVWLHVHVADPTSVIPPQHEVAQEARKRMFTVYLAHRTWPMLSKSIGDLSDMGRIPSSSGLKVISFSAKIDQEGNLKDYMVRPGIVRNVHTLTYEGVDEMIGLGDVPFITRPFDLQKQKPLSSKHSEELSSGTPYVEQLNALYEVTRRLVHNRYAMGVVSFCSARSVISFHPKPVPHNPTDATQPIFYRGFPEIQYSVETALTEQEGARSLVAECMKVAGRVASLFCLDNKIPAIRRASLAITTPAQQERLRALRNKNGTIDPTIMSNEDVGFNESQYTLLPMGHSLLGVKDGEGYVRVTSPLRRYADMVSHWNIKSVLLPSSSPQHGKLPFPEDQLKKIIHEMAHTEAVTKQADKRSRLMWSNIFIERFLEKRKRHHPSTILDIDPLHGLDAYPRREHRWPRVTHLPLMEVYIPSLGLSGMIYVRDAGDISDLKEPLKVNVKEVLHLNSSYHLMLTRA